MLRAAIDEKGQGAAIAYAREAFGNWPKHGGLIEFQNTLLDRLLALDGLYVSHLRKLLLSEATHGSTKQWIEQNVSSNHRAIVLLHRKLEQGAIAPNTRTGPKDKADAGFQFIAWQIAEDLSEIGFPRHIGGERSAKKANKFSATEVIAEAVRQLDGPANARVSASLARNWIQSIKATFG
jgi:hypothetical protein